MRRTRENKTPGTPEHLSGHHHQHLLASLQKLKQCRYTVGSLFYLCAILALVVAVLVLCHLTVDICHIDSYA
jgi:hypothetical protein